MAKQTIGIGTSANDGTGDQLRIAFDKTNDNFDEVYLAGPVGTNIRVLGNTISSTDTDGNIELTPNGAGSVVITNPAFTGALAVDSLTTTSGVTVGTVLDVADITPTGGTATITADTLHDGNLTVDGTVGIWDETHTNLRLEVASGGGVNVNSKIYMNQPAILSTATPGSAIGAVGDEAGTVTWDADYIYICTADYDGITAIWKRSPIATW
jgi:hypothetical protein